MGLSKDASIGNGTLQNKDSLIKDSASENIEEENDSKTPCPKACHFGQIFSIPTFVAFAGIVMCAQSALAIYSKSVLTSIERRFGISSSLAGFIVGSFNIGNLLFVVAVSKLSSTGHRPRIMATGSLLIALGGFVNFTPHLINEPYKPSNDSANSFTDSEVQSPSTFPHLFVLLIVGEILQGIGATVHIPLSSSYIDDFASKDNSPVYLGISFVLQNIGPGFGYLIGSWTSTKYVDFDRIPAENITVSSDDKSQWIGAWWLGYLIISVWVIVSAFPLFFFPKSMKKQNTLTTAVSSEEGSNETKQLVSQEDLCEKTPLTNSEIIKPNGHSMKVKVTCNDCERHEISLVEEEPLTKKLSFCEDFGLTVKRLITNPAYLAVVFGYSGLMFVVGALTAFMPKFLEVAYGKSAGSANLTFGLAVPPTMCIGLLSGGIIVKKFGWERSGILKFTIASGAISLIPIIATLFMGCSSLVQNCQDLISVSNLSFTSTEALVQPICDHSVCYSISIAFVVVVSVGAMLSANMVTPIYIVVLRSVSPADKCTAIGVMFLIIRVLGLVPSPIITGAVIDQTCLKWNEENGENTNCALYDVEQFRIRYLVIIILAIFSCILFNIVALLFVKREDKIKNKTPTKTVSSVLRQFIKKSRDSTTDDRDRPSSL